MTADTEALVARLREGSWGIDATTDDACMHALNDLASDAANLIESLMRDLARHRQALIDVGRNVGALLADDVSGDTLMLIPRETRLVVDRLKRDRDQARTEAATNEDAITAVRDVLQQADVPTAAFVDDHVRYAVVQRDQARAEAAALRERAEKAASERDLWRARESETQEELQRIGEEFGVRGGEPRTQGIRRVLAEMRQEAAALRERVAQLEEVLRPFASIGVTEEMVEAACRAQWQAERSDKNQHYSMRAALEAALARVPGASNGNDGAPDCHKEPKGAILSAEKPVAWQYRYRPTGTTTWSDWADGKAPQMRGGSYQTQERPLYAVPPPFDAAAGKAEPVAFDPLDGGCPHCRWLDTNLGRVLQKKCDLHQKIEDLQVDLEMERRVARRLKDNLAEIASIVGADPEDNLLQIIRDQAEELEAYCSDEPQESDDTAVQAAYERGRANERERISDILTDWTRADRIRLAAGEMTAQEMRTIKAVLAAIAAAIREGGEP